MPNQGNSIAELEARLAEAKATAAAEAKARRDAVKMVRTYTVEPDEREWTKLYDPDCCFYSIKTQIVNLDECKAAGLNVDSHNQGMAYLFNKATGRIVMSSGGGYVHIDDGFGTTSSEAAIDAFDRVSAFILAFPEGGDITDIVLAFRKQAGKD
jgi:hypothetical protein